MGLGLIDPFRTEQRNLFGSFMSVVTKNLVFYHMPKAGGSFIEKTIDQLGIAKARTVVGQHFAPIDDHNRAYENRFSFTLIRNPIQWIRSVYGWMRKYPEMYDMLNRCAVLSSCVHVEAYDGPMTDSDGGFKRFVNKYIDKMPGVLSILYNDYADKCDFVAKNESLRDDLKFALTSAGEVFDPMVVEMMPIINETSTEESKLYKWDLELIDRFIESERNIFERWYPHVLDYLPKNELVA